MLLIYVLVIIVMNLDSTPKAAALNDDYNTLAHCANSIPISKPRIAAITTGDGFTNVFIPSNDSQEISIVFSTNDFFSCRYYGDIVLLKDRGLVPLFAVFDPDTTGLTRDYVMGVRKGSAKEIVSVRGVDGSTKKYCEDCIDTLLTGYTSTSWDNERKRWVSLADLSTGDAFALSTDLKHWTTQNWLSNAGFGSYENILEMFPITDQDDPDKTVWVLIRNSELEAGGLRTLLWDTFAPDDADQKYKAMGVLDASPYINEYSLVNDNSTDYRSRRVLVSQRADYTAYGIKYNTFFTGRELTYEGGRLRQMPIGTAYGTPTYQRYFPTIAYVQDSDVLKCLPPSRSFTIEAVLTVVDEGSGFDFFINPDDDEDYAVSISITGSKQYVILERENWFAPGPAPSDPYRYLYNFFSPPVNGDVKVLVWVDVCTLEYFILDGIYVGSILVFPNLNYNHHEIYSSEDTTITNLTFTKYDDIGL